MQTERVYISHSAYYVNAHGVKALRKCEVTIKVLDVPSQNQGQADLLGEKVKSKPLVPKVLDEIVVTLSKGSTLLIYNDMTSDGNSYQLFVASPRPLNDEEKAWRKKNPDYYYEHDFVYQKADTPLATVNYNASKAAAKYYKKQSSALDKVLAGLGSLSVLGAGQVTEPEWDDLSDKSYFYIKDPQPIGLDGFEFEVSCHGKKNLETFHESMGVQDH